MCKAVRTVDDLGFILISTFGKVLQIFYINKMIPVTCYTNKRYIKILIELRQYHQF